MTAVQLLEKLRPLGSLEQVSASCHHLGFFNNVGVTASYRLSESSSPAAFDLGQLVFTAAGDVIRKHRILSAIPVDEDTPNTYFASLPLIDLHRNITFLRRSQPLSAAKDGQDKDLDAILEDQHNTSFKSQYGTLPFWRLIVLQDPVVDEEFTASFIYHHAIGDGVSGLVFHNAFREALEAASSQSLSKNNTAGILKPDENSCLLPPLEQLHPLQINPAPPSPPEPNLREWTGNSICTPCKSRWISLSLSQSTSQAFFRECQEHKVSVTSALSSTIATALFSILPPTAEALTCIIPVSLRRWLKLPREAADAAIGTYFDATRVQFTRGDQDTENPSSVDFWLGAQRASKAINDYLTNVSASGEPYTAVALFETIPDVSVFFNSLLGKPRDAAFEVTNIGHFSSSTTLTTLTTKDAPRWHVGKVLLSRSAVVSGAAVTVSVTTGGDGSMTLGFSWQEGVVKDELIDKLIEIFRKYFEKYQ